MTKPRSTVPILPAVLCTETLVFDIIEKRPSTHWVFARRPALPRFGLSGMVISMNPHREWKARMSAKTRSLTV